MIYRAIYKCRACGKEHGNMVTGNEKLAMNDTMATVYGWKCDGPIHPTMNDIHLCNDGSFGVSDFIGFKKEE